MPDSREAAIAAFRHVLLLADNMLSGPTGDPEPWRDVTSELWSAGQTLLDHIENEPASTSALAVRLEAEIRPLINTRTAYDGYDCCGCSTYGKILDHAIRIVRGEADDG